MSGPLGMVCECSWCGENWRHDNIGGVRCDRCSTPLCLCPPCWWKWRDHHPPRPKCCQLKEVVMEPMGQNLGGSERPREDVLLAEVRRLKEENDVLLEGCKYGVRYLTEAFGAESSITVTLRSVVEGKQAGAW